METTSGRWSGEIRRRPGDAREPLDRAVQRRERAQEPDRVRMARIGAEPLRRCLLDDLAGVHDRHAVRELEQQREVVRDEEHREAEL